MDSSPTCPLAWKFKVSGYMNMVERPTRDEISAPPAFKRAHSILVWSSRLLLIAGGLALGALSAVYLQAHVYQRYLQSRFLLSSRATEMPVASADPPIGATPHRADMPPGTVTFGKIDIPAVGLTAMVLEGDDERTLRLAVGHIPGTAIPGPSGNVGIAGHRDTFFRPLRKINVGDEIRFFTNAGTFKYRVVSLRIVLPDAIDVLDDTKRPTLTLVTCYPFYYIGAAPKRFIVHAEMVPASLK